MPSPSRFVLGLEDSVELLFEAERPEKIVVINHSYSKWVCSFYVLYNFRGSCVIVLPGGMWEEGDEDDANTALREKLDWTPRLWRLSY